MKSKDDDSQVGDGSVHVDSGGCVSDVMDGCVDDVVCDVVCNVVCDVLCGSVGDCVSGGEGHGKVKWLIFSFFGFWWLTDGWTDEQTLVVVESLLRLKIIQIKMGKFYFS